MYRYAAKSMDSTQAFGKHKFSNRRPKKVSLRKKKIVLREIRRLREEFWLFAIKRLRLVSGRGNKVCDETVRKLVKEKGCKFLHSRKKGLLKPEDLKERITFFQKD